MSSSHTFDQQKFEEFCGRLFNATIDMGEVATVYFGERLGLYDALKEKGPITAPKLAEHLGLNKRYVSEWLVQQAIAGFIDVENGTDDPAARRYSISPEHAVVLTDRTSHEYLGFVGMFFEAVGRVMPALLEGFKTGKGVPYSAYGPGAVEVQAAINLPRYLDSLVRDWVPQIPGLAEKLQAGAKGAELACGTGVAAIEIAEAYPNVTIDGYDLDESSIAIARRNAADAGVSDRVTFHVQDAQDALAGAYDCVAVFEAIHDMGDPVAPLATVKRLLAPGGVAFVVDEKVQDEFTAPADEIERFMALSSVIWCLPQGLAQGPDAHGTLLRAPEFAGYAKRAGWSGVEVLAIEDMTWRFYRLVA